MINGHTEIIAHIGYPTHSFKAPMIYNPFFEEKGINAIVVPMGCRAQEFSAFLPLVFRLANIRGALITMPHKVSVVSLLDEVTPAVQVAGACNAVRLSPEGRLQGDMFDGEGFVRGLQNKGLGLQGCRALVVGAGGVGRAITASLAASGVASLSLFDVDNASAQGLADRVREHYPSVQVQTGSCDPEIGRAS
ncbi:MAG: shikimate dehydrogenase family protein, partial [Limnohabitans sp.]